MAREVPGCTKQGAKRGRSRATPLWLVRDERERSYGAFSHPLEDFAYGSSDDT